MAVYKRDKQGHTITRKLEGKTPGTYYFAFMMRGVRYREAIPEARTRTQAERAEVSAKEDVYNNRYGLRRSILFADFVERDYRPWAEANKRSYATGDAVYLKPLLTFFGRYRLAEITPMLIERYKKQRRELPTIHGHARKPSSINRELECLSRILSLAVDNKHLGSNPMGAVRKLRMDNRRNRYLSRKEEAALMIALDNAPEYLKPLVALAIQTGMRRGELFKLQWSDVDFSRNTIYVRDMKDPLRSRDREIPMSAAARAVLEAIERRNDHVFHIGDVKKPFARALRLAKIENFHFHDLRHTAATRWAEAGATPMEISYLLGNSIIVGARYTHAIHANLRRVVDGANRPGLATVLPIKKENH